MSTSPTAEEKQQLREAILRVLAPHPTVTLHADALRFHVRERQFLASPPSLSDVREALAVLQGLGFVAEIENRLGAVGKWQATADGVLFYERNLDT